MNKNGRTTNGTNTSNQRRTMPTTNDELRVLWIAAITFPPNSCSPCAASGLTVTGASSFLRLRLEAEERSCRRDVRPGCSIEQPGRQCLLLTRVLSNRDVPFFAGPQQKCTDHGSASPGDHRCPARGDQIEHPIRAVAVRVADIPEAANLCEHDQNATVVAASATDDDELLDRAIWTAFLIARTAGVGTSAKKSRNTRAHVPRAASERWSVWLAAVIGAPPYS